MKQLTDITTHLEILDTRGSLAAARVKGITMDSREVAEGWLFVAVKGTRTDGHAYIEKAFAQGAVAVVCENFPEDSMPGTLLKVADSSIALGLAASAFYDFPSSKLTLVGVTGTNGKTTVSSLLYELFTRLGYRAGLISTVKNKIFDKEVVATHTTPDAVSLNRLLNEMVEYGCDYCFMECSSHAIHQNRIKGLTFKGGVFTNITHDHLDYHATFDNYLKAKKQFFDQLSSDAFALTNKDDRNGMVMLQNTKASRYTYSVSASSDFKAKILEHDFNGMLLSIDGTDAWYRLVGKFNAYNLLAVYGTAFLLGIAKEQIIEHLTTIGSVKGRFEYVNGGKGITGVVDYAHTPDALKNILQVINEVRTNNETLITVIGCGGDRDSAKRPLMAEIAAELSNKVIFTSDNPRSEDPETILAEMEKGVSGIYYKKTLKITDRREAIKTAVSMAKPGDVILVAGKGHENYQEIQGVKYPFDDMEVLKEMFQLIQS